MFSVHLPETYIRWQEEVTGFYPISPLHVSPVTNHQLFKSHAFTLTSHTIIHIYILESSNLLDPTLHGPTWNLYTVSLWKTGQAAPKESIPFCSKAWGHGSCWRRMGKQAMWQTSRRITRWFSFLPRAINTSIPTHSWRPRSQSTEWWYTQWKYWSACASRNTPLTYLKYSV